MLSLLETMRLHIARLREGIAREEDICRRLEGIIAGLDAREDVSLDAFLETMEAMTTMEKYYTPEQLQELRERREVIGEERIHEVEAAWPVLREEVRAEMERGTPPSDPRVQALAKRWSGLVAEFTGNNPGIETSLNTLYSEESTVHGMETGPMREMGEYIGQALAKGRTDD